MAAARGAARVLLQRLDAEAGAHERAHDLADAPQPVRVGRLAEVVVAPAEEVVDAVRDRMVVEDEQLAVLAQRRRDAALPSRRDRRGGRARPRRE